MDTLNVIVQKYVDEDIGKRDVIFKYYKLFTGRYCTDDDITRELKVWTREVTIKQYTLHFITNLFQQEMRDWVVPYAGWNV